MILKITIVSDPSRVLSLTNFFYPFPATLTVRTLMFFGPRIYLGCLVTGDLLLHRDYLTESSPSVIKNYKIHRLWKSRKKQVPSSSLDWSRMYPSCTFLFLSLDSKNQVLYTGKVTRYQDGSPFILKSSLDTFQPIRIVTSIITITFETLHFSFLLYISLPSGSFPSF